MDRPFPAYRGGEPFTFVCYAHEDVGVVYPELTSLRERGLNLWYDEGVSAGRNWREEIGVSLLNARHMLFYISRASLASEHCNREVNLALDEGKTIVPVYLDDIELTPDLKVGLTRVQALHRDDSAGYLDQLISALGSSDVLEPRGGPPPRRRVAPPLGLGLIVIALIGLVAWYATRPPRLDGPDRSAETAASQSVGVRSFSTLGESPNLTHYAALATDDVKAALANSNIRLVAVDVAAGASADFTVDGRVRETTQGTRLTIELRRSADGQVIWATMLDDPAVASSVEEFERAPFVARMVETVLGYLNWRYNLERDGTKHNPLALDAFFAGMTEFSERQLRAGGDWSLMVNHFERAFELDPELGPACNMLATVYAVRLGATITVADALPKAHQWVQRCLVLDPDNTMALGLINLHLDLDYTSAVANFVHAKPRINVGTLESQLCMTAFAQGHLDEAVRHCQAAIAAGSTGQAEVLRMMGLLWFYAGRYHSARAMLEDALRNSGTGSNPVTLTIKTLADFMDGDTVAANETLDDALGRFRDESPELLVAPLALLGRTEEARGVLEETLVRHRSRANSLAHYAPTFWGYYYLGELDEAFIWLNQAIENRELLLIGALRTFPELEEIRAHPRFEAAMARLEEIEAKGSPTQSVPTS